MKTIKLEIPEGITHLGGNELGRYICCNQVDPFISKNDKEIEIEIPDHIENIAVGFVQGLKAIIDLDNKDIEVKFKAKSKKLEDKLIRDYNY